MSDIRRIELGAPALLEFRGPDAVRFLNGQITQDVRRVVNGDISLPSCVTDAKGKLQFRVSVTAVGEDALWVAGPADRVEELKARLTRYLIADDVEMLDLTGRFTLWHFTGAAKPPPAVVARMSNRLGIDGTDWWIPEGLVVGDPVCDLMDCKLLEALRITNGIPVWGKELHEGMLPPEALLDATDISYNKGCYIGQEVISRIKSAGKVNKRLTRFIFEAAVPVTPGPLEHSAGEITSVAPIAEDGIRHALGFLKRGAEDPSIRAADGLVYPARTA